MGGLAYYGVGRPRALDPAFTILSPMLHRLILASCSLLASPLLLAAPQQVPFDSERVLNTRFEVPADSTMADVDGDGDLDWVGVEREAARAVWSENVGGARFGPLQWIGSGPIAVSTQSIRMADLDGDGDLDALGTRANPFIDDPVGWYENMGGGRWGPYQVLTTVGSSGFHGRAQDLDGDGDQDVVYVSSAFDVLWIENVGGGSFGSPVILATNPGGVMNLELGDLNGDSHIDLVWTFAAGNEVAWVPGQGGGSFLPRVTLTTQVATPRDLQLLDLDGDLDLDVLLTTGQNNSIVWLPGRGDGTVNTPGVLASGLSFTEQVRAGDLDGDGDLDLVSASRQPSALQWHQNIGGNLFANPIPLDPQQDSLARFFLTDLDEDGDLDVFTGANDLAWFENLSPGFASLAPVAPQTLQGTPLDFDGDGDQDLLSIDPDLDAAVVQINDGFGSFPSTEILVSGIFEFTDLEMFDADGDGDLDLFGAQGNFQSASATVRWFQNQAGTFVDQGQIYLRLTDSETMITQADMDSDGDQDLLVQHQTGFSFGNYDVTWVRNEGGGVFTTLSTLFLERGLPTKPIDVNGDGNMDLLVQSRVLNDFELGWSQNIGGGFMTLPIPIQTYPVLSLKAFAPVDLDQDGDTDIVTAETNGFRVDWIENLGSSTFAAPAPVGTLNESGLVVDALDVDLDGVTDVIAWDTTEARWFRNTGGATFAPGEALPHLAGPLQPLSLHVADMDGDGDLDLLKETERGTLLQRNRLRFGLGYCPPTSQHSGGTFGKLYAQGSASIATNQFTLVAFDLPQQQFGFFLVSNAPGFVMTPGISQGNLCLGGSIGRMNRSAVEIFFTGSSGSSSVPLDLTDVPTALGPETLQAGLTRYFQAWFRDQNPGTTSNFTGGLRVSFE